MPFVSIMEVSRRIFRVIDSMDAGSGSALGQQGVEVDVSMKRLTA